jgi:methionyl-tRNA formyltransferase
MDTGPVIAQARLLIAPRDTTETLSEKLSHIGAELLIATIPAWLAGGIGPVPQDDVLASYAPQITKRDGAIAWSRSAEEIDRQVRAYTPWPGVFTTYHGRGLRIQRAVPLSTYPGGGVPGTVIDTAQGIGVMTGRGLLLLEALQLEGKRSLSGKDFARGQRGFVGSILG